MTSTTEAEPDVTDDDVTRAEREATEAAELVDALEDRVRDGDDSVTPDQIEQARSLGRFARLRAQATARKAERTKERQRRQALEQARTEIRQRMADEAGGLADVDKALTDVSEAVERFITLAEAHNAWHAEMRQRIRDLAGVDPHSTRGGDREAQLAFADPERTVPGYVALDGQLIHEALTGDLLAAAIYLTARKHRDPHPGSPGGLPVQGGYSSVETVLTFGALTDPDGFHTQMRQQLAEQAAQARANTEK
ncbi:hypothetical protein CSH63_29295 [Micromonospora tulbaghiae]|uniref:Uncharacterized protein n=1 Tax=Micromonospora tulbaghiae TaxID=479978 RepID=A0A386WVN8_9ACTN|nr:hypothetical protein [Micromonospora tulbaghiae]AYF31470.1 hypothetical protein CSH63_29295 [Micromonospora tulbaghiae]